MRSVHKLGDVLRRFSDAWEVTTSVVFYRIVRLCGFSGILVHQGVSSRMRGGRRGPSAERVQRRRTECARDLRFCSLMHVVPPSEREGAARRAHSLSGRELWNQKDVIKWIIRTRMNTTDGGVARDWDRQNEWSNQICRTEGKVIQ